MRHSLFLSPVLILLVGCMELDSLLPSMDVPGEEPVVEESEEEAVDDGTEDTSEDTGDGTPDTDPEVGCCALEILGPDTVTAGDLVEITAVLRNDNGDDVTADAVFEMRVSGPDGDVVYSELSFQALAAGAYTVTVSVASPEVETEAALPLQVEVGPLAVMEMNLSKENVDPGDSVTVEVSGWDIAGNAIEVAEVDVSVSPTTCAEVDGRSLLALEDGDCAVTARVGDLSEAAGFMIDGNGPLLTLTSPERGSFLDAGSLSITGEVEDAGTGVASLTVAGQSVSGLSFSVGESLTAGAHTITMVAEDNEGNTSDLSAGVLVGDFLADDESFSGIWTQVSAESIATMSEALDDALPLSEMEDAVLAASPLLDDTGSDCEGTLVEVIDASVGGATVEMEPGEGSLTAVVTVTDIQVDLEAEVSVEYFGQCFTEQDTDTIFIDTAEVTLSIALDVEDGEVVAEVLDSASTTTGVDDGLAGELGLDVAGMLSEMMLEMVEESLPEGLESALSGTTVSESFSVMDADVSLDASVAAIETTADGIAMQMETLAECSDVVLDAPGSITMVESTPTLSDDGAALSIDVLNRMLFLAWRSGAMNEVLSDAELGIDEAIIGLLFPGATTLSMEMEPQLPPVVMDVGADQPMSLDMAELQLVAWGEVDGTEEMLGRIAVHLSGEVTPSIIGGNLALDINIASMEADAVDYAASDVASGESLEDLMSLFGGSLGGDLLSDLSVPLPAALGTPSDARTDGSGWLLIDTE
ncbi:MAG: hypothetical protein P8R54_03540 [Myxococcota bacterium]|nr:hypothetical protein [Myxococcota bacterium]